MIGRITSIYLLAGSAVALALIGAGCASMRPADLKANEADARAEIERRLHQVLAAAESKDFERLESYHLYGPKFTRFSGASPARQDAAATRKIEHDGLAAMKSLKLRADALKVDVFGDTGVATCILNASFDAGGGMVSVSDRSTFVFVKERGDWKIAHEHSSPIKAVEPGSAVNPTQRITSQTNQSGRSSFAR